MAAEEPTPLTELEPQGCICNYGPVCVCPPTEKALRYIATTANDIVLTDPQREWCLKEICSIEGYRREDYAGTASQDLARGVLEAWTDFCRDKGLL